MTKFNSKQTQPSLDWLDENESFSGCDFIDSFDEFDLPPKDIDMENLDRLADELSEELDPNGEFDFPIQKVDFFDIKKACSDINSLKGDFKKLIEVASMAALCRIGKSFLGDEKQKLFITAEDLLIAFIGNSSIENGLRHHYKIRSKLIPYPPALIEKRTALFSAISDVNYDISSSGDLSDWTHLKNKQDAVSFDEGKILRMLQELVMQDLKTQQLSISSSIDLSKLNIKAINEKSACTQLISDFINALSRNHCEIENQRTVRAIEKKLNRHIINNAANLKSCVRFSNKIQHNCKVNSVMSLIGPSESGRSALIEATIETTNKLNNTRVQQKTIDCSQYVHENCIAHFVGIEPFYRNPKQGMLTSFVEQNPYSIIVFKNLNMAHPNLQCLVQGLLENGYLEDITTERIVSFEHTQIIISLESDMVTQTTNTNLELSGADLLLEKDLGLESSLGALLTSYTVLKTERLKGQDSYALCQRMFQRLLTHEENLHVEYPRYMSALLFIACGKNTLPSAMESTISDIFEQIKTLNYDYIIDHDLFEQPRIEVKDEILPRQIAMVGMYHDLTFSSNLKVTCLSESEALSDIEMLTAHNMLIINRGSESILNSLTSVNLPHDFLIIYIGEAEGVDNKFSGLIDCYLPLFEYHSSDELYAQVMTHYAIKVQARHLRRQTEVNLLASVKFDEQRNKLEIVFDKCNEHVSFDSKILQNPLFKINQPSQRLSDVIGYDRVKKQINSILSQMNQYQKGQQSPPKGLIFEGPPGTGKTFLALAMAGESELNVVLANSSDFMTSNGAADINALVDAAESIAPAIIFLDEFDSIGRNRENQTVGYASIVNTLLTRMDGTSKPDAPVLFVAATNHVDKLDPALLRAGRFDVSIKFELPSMADRVQGIKRILRSKHIETSMDDLQLLAVMCDGLTHKAIENKIQDILVLAKKNLEKNSEVLEARHIISYMFPTPSPSKTYCAQQESNITIKSYRIAASIIANHLLSANTKHFYANSWHERYFYETSNYAQESYAQSYTGLKKLLAKRAGEALYLGDEKLACRLNKHELVQMRALINSGVCSLQLAEDDLMEELSNQQVHGNAASALARKAYKEVKFLLSEHWDELEKLAQKLISNNEIHQDELTSLLGAVTSDSEVLDLIH